MKTIKLNQKQLRSIINEAIQGRRPGEPEPFAFQEIDAGLQEANEARDKMQEATALIGEVHSLLQHSKHAGDAAELFAKAYSLMNVVDEELNTRR